MFKRYSGFKTINISGIRIRTLFISLMLGTALSFILIGMITMLRVENGLPSSVFDKVTKHVAIESLARIAGESIPYLSEELRVSGIEKSTPRIVMELATNINFKDPRTLLGKEIPLFSFFNVDGYGTNKMAHLPIESPPPADLDKEIERVLNNSRSGSKTLIESPSNRLKQVLVYNSHYWESFYPEIPNKKPSSESKDFAANATDLKINVTKLSQYLVKKLEKRGIGAERRSRIFKSGDAYLNSRQIVAEAISQNKSLKYMIDIHRDVPRRQDTTCTINKKSHAKMMFVVGKSSEHYEQNLKLAQKLHDGLIKYHPELSKGVLAKPRTHTTNGEYNQSMSPGVIVLEMGGPENSFEELYRSLDILSEVLGKIIKEK